MKQVEYKLFYKLPSVVWKNFYFDAESDEKALEFVKNYVNKWKIESYGVEKITKERLK